MKNKIVYLAVFFLASIYLFFDTRIYSFNWKERKYLGNEGVKIFFISNPPKDKFDLLDLTVSHIKSLESRGLLTNTKEIVYIRETWLTNRFYNLNENWDSEVEWQFERIEASIQHFYNRRSPLSLNGLGCYKLLDENTFATTLKTDNLFQLDNYFSWMYFTKSIDIKYGIYWVKLKYRNQTFVECDNLSVPIELTKNKKKWKNLSR